MANSRQGNPVKVISRTESKAPARYFVVQIDTKKNEPLVHESKQIEWNRQQGTQVAIEVEGRYQKGLVSLDEYLEQTFVANPHVSLIYRTSEGETKQYPAAITSCRPRQKKSSRIPTASNSGCSSRCSRRARPKLFRAFSRASSVESRLARG